MKSLTDKILMAFGMGMLLYDITHDQLIGGLVVIAIGLAAPVLLVMITIALVVSATWFLSWIYFPVVKSDAADAADELDHLSGKLDRSCLEPEVLIWLEEQEQILAAAARFSAQRPLVQPQYSGASEKH